MPNVYRYFITLIILFGIIKIIQITAFDSEYFEKLIKQENKNKIKKELPSKMPKQKESAKKTSEPETKIKSQAQASLQSTPKPDFKTGLEKLKNEYLNPLLEKIPVGHLRKDIVIRYYRHKKDGDGVQVLHDELAYYIHEKEATETAGLGSNVIYYGDDVPLEDIQIVAFTLLEQGIPIKSIEHTKFEWKTRAIEIGTDVGLLNDSIISAELIVDFHKQYLKNEVLAD